MVQNGLGSPPRKIRAHSLSCQDTHVGSPRASHGAEVRRRRRDSRRSPRPTVHCLMATISQNRWQVIPLQRAAQRLSSLRIVYAANKTAAVARINTICRIRGARLRSRPPGQGAATPGLGNASEGRRKQNWAFQTYTVGYNCHERRLQDFTSFRFRR